MPLYITFFRSLWLYALVHYAIICHYIITFFRSVLTSFILEKHFSIVAVATNKIKAALIAYERMHKPDASPFSPSTEKVRKFYSSYFGRAISFNVCLDVDRCCRLHCLQEGIEQGRLNALGRIRLTT